MNPIRQLVDVIADDDDVSAKSIVAVLMLVLMGFVAVVLLVAGIATWPWLGIPLTLGILVRTYLWVVRS